LLEKLGGGPASGELLRSLRALEVLEDIGTPPAQQVLQTLAEGFPEARITWEAKASLSRLQRKTAADRCGRTKSRLARPKPPGATPTGSSPPAGLAGR